MVSRWDLVMAKIQVASAMRSSVRGWLRKRARSMPSWRRTSTVCMLGGWPRMALTPALATRRSLRPATSLRKRPSAMGLRQTFPVQIKRMVLGVRCSSMERRCNVHTNEGVIKSGGMMNDEGMAFGEQRDREDPRGRSFSKRFGLVKGARRF